MKKIILTSVVALAASCIPLSTDIATLDGVPLAAEKSEWSSYGAYYEVDDLSIEMTGAQTRYVVNKRVRILTNDGTPYASVAVPYIAPLSRFSVSMRDASGNAVPLNSYNMKAEYRKTGVIVFPRATAGCVLDLSLVFLGMNVLTAFEYTFYEPIPILRSTFTFSYQAGKYTYAFKTYGEQCGARPATTTGRLTTKCWSKDSWVPPPRIAYMKNIYETVSRVSLVLRSYSTGQLYFPEKEIFASWSDLAEGYNKLLQNALRMQSSPAIREKARDLTAGLESDSAKADAILCWVQDSLSLREDDEWDIDPDRTMEKREACVWELTFVLQEMFKSIGCFSDILITRGKHRGGFDPEFVTPRSLALPVVVAECEKKKYVAYPYVRGSKLGEYPASFFDLCGLSLATSRPDTLPEPPSRVWECTFRYGIDVARDSVSQNLTARFNGYWGYDMRTDLTSLKQEAIKEYFQKMLTNFGLSNALLTCSVANLAERGAPLVANLTFATPGQYIERKGRKLYKLDHLFGSYFSFYDSSRTSRFSTDMDEVISEEIVAPRTQGVSAEFHVTCDAIDNALFTVTCEEQQNMREYRFARTLHIKKSDLSAGQMRLVYPDIQRLKGIGESYVSFR